MVKPCERPPANDIKTPRFSVPLDLADGIRIHLMDIEFLLGGILTVALTIYLLYALVRPEHF
jgi:K+-transporting ATPase KdpF subunit